MKLCDVNEVYKVLTDYYHLRTEIQRKALKEAIERMPTVEAEPIKHGHWIFNPKDAIEMMFTLPKCSECGAESPNGGNYCPNCGAKMDEVEDGKNG